MSSTWDDKVIKTVPLALDEVLLIDTADGRNQKRATLTSLGATHWSRNAGSGLLFPSVLTDKTGFGLNNPTELVQMFGGNFSLKPHNPVRLSTISDAVNLNKPSDLHVIDNHVFIVSETGKSITVIDNSIPTAPVIIGFLNDPTNLDGVRGVFVAGNFLYAACGGTGNVLAVFDISTPKTPVFISKLAITNADKIFVSGIHAFVTATAPENKLHIIDIHEPAILTLDGTFTDAGMIGPTDVVVSGRYVYVTAETSDSLVIIDALDDTNPVLKGKVLDSTNLNGAQALYIVGNHVYVVSNVGNSLAIVDVSDLAVPVVQTGSLLNPVFETNNVLDGANSIFAAENHVYITSPDVSAVTIVNVAIHTAPVVVGAVVDVPNLGDVSGLFMSGKHIHTVSPTSNSFSIIDVHGVDVPAAIIGSLEIGTLSVRDNLTVADAIYGSTLNIGNSALIGGQLSVSEKLKVFGDFNTANDLFVVNSVDKSVQIGGTTVAADFSIVQQTTQAKRGILLTGNGFFGGATTTDGVFISNILNIPGNMQIGIGQLSDFLDVNKSIFRYTFGIAVPNVGGVSGSGSINRHISLGNQASFVAVGFDVVSTAQISIQANLHVKAGTTGTIAQIIQAVGTPTVDLFQVRNSSSVAQIVIDENFRLGIGVLNPTVPLDVLGAAKFTGNLDMTNQRINNVGILEINNPANTFQYIITGAPITISDKILNLPLINGTDTLAALDTVQTWSAKQIFMSTLMDINNPANTFAYQFQSSAITVNTTVTLPLLTANDTFAFVGFPNVFTSNQQMSGDKRLIIGNGINTFIRAPSNDIIEVFAANNLQLTVRSEGVIIGDGDTQVSRDEGFLHIPNLAGTPSGAPFLIANVSPMAFDTVDNDLYVYSGGWNKVSSKIFAKRVQKVDNTLNNTTAFQNEFAISLRANKVYSGFARIYMNSPVAPGFKYQFLVPTGSTGAVRGSGGHSSTTPSSTVPLTDTTILVTDGTTQVVEIHFKLKSGSAENLIFRWSQQTATAVDSKFLLGSDMVLWEEES